jgi:arsenate reductase-like glutaredoxin family protein
VHFVDLKEKSASVGELRRFAQKFGIAALVDRESKRFAELGLRSAILGDERWLEKLSLEPLLLRMPLVRNQQQLTVGLAQETWNDWYAASRS